MTEIEKSYLIEHMKMNQEIITRMNKNSFQLKGWMVTIVAACLALYGSSSNVTYIWIAIAPTIIFWLLDSFYLREEKKYVALHGKLVEAFNGKITIERIELFNLSTKEYKDESCSIFSVMYSKTEWPLYFSVIAGLVIAGIIINN